MAVLKARIEFHELEKDEDEGPLLWLAIAHLQWKYGNVDQQTLARVRSDIENERGLERWRDDPKDLGKRKAMLAKFLAKLESPNPRPSPLPKQVIRKAPFHKGDCLSVLLPDGRYTAALVLREDNSNPEHGLNLAASLDYLDKEPPDLDVFRRKEWLVLTHGNWENEEDICWYFPGGLREMRKRIQVIGNIRPGWFAPRNSRSHTAWTNLGVQIVYCREKAAS